MELRTSEDIVKDIQDYFNSYKISRGRWKLEEVSIRINRKSGAIEVLAILLPKIKCKSLSDLG
jgi:hypothetical protein